MNARLNIDHTTGESALDTNLGPMTGAQIIDELTYRSYEANRGYGMTPERLALFFGEVPVEAMERRYRSERRMDEGGAVWPQGV